MTHDELLAGFDELTNMLAEEHQARMHEIAGDLLDQLIESLPEMPTTAAVSIMTAAFAKAALHELSTGILFTAERTVAERGGPYTDEELTKAIKALGSHASPSCVVSDVESGAKYDCSLTLSITHTPSH